MKYIDIINMAKSANFITANPIASALGAGTIAGIASQVGGNIWDRKEEQKPAEPINLNPLEASTQTNINTGVGVTTGALTTAALYKLLGNIPLLQRRKLLKATISLLGGTGVGTLAWNAANNYQNNTRNI